MGPDQFRDCIQRRQGNGPRVVLEMYVVKSIHCGKMDGANRADTWHVEYN